MMLKTTFVKTIYTKRWLIIGWTAGIAALVIFTMVFYPTLSKSFGESLKNVPDSLKAFVGDSSAYSTIAGYTDLQIFSQLVFMTIILGVILFTGLLAGEENEGTLQTLLVQPITRGRAYVEKLLAGMVLLGIACLGLMGGVVLGVVIIGEHLGMERLLLATLALWLVTLVFSMFGFALGAITGKRGLAGGLAGALAFTSLLVSSLAASVSALKTADKLSPFHYFNKPGILQYGVRWNNLIILALLSAVMAIIGFVLFKRRDVYPK
jgi:ABC-2 type transport system permease protein